MFKIVSFTDRPLTRSEMNHLGSAADEWGNPTDLAVWPSTDSKVVICTQGLDKPPEDSVFIVVDVATAVRLALRLGTLSAGIVADLSRQLGKDRHG
jgi:hypothetical protein